MIGKYKFEIFDVVKIPFKRKIVDGRVEWCNVYYDIKSNKKYNQYHVSIQGAKHFKKISEPELLTYNPNGRTKRTDKPNRNTITISQSVNGPNFMSCHISGDINFDEFVGNIKSLYLGHEVDVK